MARRFSMSEASQRIAEVASLVGADRLDVMRLIDIAELDPASDFRFENWSGVDFSHVDLSRFDFTGARLHGCAFRDANLAQSDGGNFKRTKPGIGPQERATYLTRFDQAELGRVIHRPGRDPQLPAELTPIANPREAKNWDFYIHACLHNWKRSPVHQPDDHLPVGAIFQDAPFAPEMVLVPAGAFMIGTAPEELSGLSGLDVSDYHMWVRHEAPKHAGVIPHPFAVGRFAITFDEWDLFASANGLEKKQDDEWGRGRRPVINVTWNEAVDYVTWLTEVTGKPYRLLSEAEWEYCCRAGTETTYCTGDAITKEQARFSAGRTVEVGSYSCNAWGLHDMHGNVWEWCRDIWHDSYNGAPTDGTAWLQGGNIDRRVVRGGSWNFNRQDLRSAYRGRQLIQHRSNDLGFRVARTLGCK